MGGHDGWLIDWLIQTLRDMSPTTAFLSIAGVLLLCGLGLPMPEDVILITAGFLSSLGKFPLWVAVLLGLVGVLSGDAVLFFLGRRYGENVFRLPIVRRMMSEEKLARAMARVRENGRAICFVARFLPGLRSPIYLMAGAMGIPPRTYMVQDGLAASISVPVWVVAGWYFGPEIESALLWARDFQGVLLVVVLSGIAAWVLWKWRASRTTKGEEA